MLQLRREREDPVAVGQDAVPRVRIVVVAIVAGRRIRSRVSERSERCGTIEKIVGVSDDVL